MLVDVCILAFVILFGIQGFMKGLTRHAWWIVAAVVTFLLTEPVTSAARSAVGATRGLSFIGGLMLELAVGFALFLVVGFGGAMLGQSMADGSNTTLAENKPLGGLVGMAQGLLVATVIVWGVGYFFLRAVSDDRMFIQVQLTRSHLTPVLDRYNPLNLLVLNKVRPYLPKDVTGRRRARVSPSVRVEQNPHFQDLVRDTSFLEAYRGRHYMRVLTNPSFRRVVQDTELLDALDEAYVESDADIFNWQDSP